MPRVVVTKGAVTGLTRCRTFLSAKSPEAAQRAGQAIAEQLERLEHFPEIGYPDDEDPPHRILVIDFGATGFLAQYRFDAGKNVVYVTAFRHQREAGF